MHNTAQITISDIKAAADRLQPYLTRTPLLSSPFLDARMGGKVFVKAECLQRTGSFKLRGALNAILQLSAAEKAAGVVAYSSGNHAQGVAFAAQIAGVDATIVMPEDAPTVKQDRTRRFGGKVVTYNRQTESREDIAHDIAERNGAVVVPPFDHPHVIAGQGTAGLEIAEEMKRFDLVPDQVVVCASGGGLSAGVGLALKDVFPDIRVITAEPVGFDDIKRSLVAGERVSNTPGAQSICDALLLPRPGALTFPILKALGATGVAASDQEAMAAIKYAAEELKVVLEPGGAVAFASILSGAVPSRGKTTVGILTGGNVDREIFLKAINNGAIG